MSAESSESDCSGGIVVGDRICCPNVVSGNADGNPGRAVGDHDPHLEVVSMAVAAELLCRSRTWLKRKENRETLNLVDGPRPSHVTDQRFGFLTADSVAAALRSEAESRDAIMRAPSTLRTFVDQKQSPGV